MTNFQLAQVVDTSDHWIRTMTGIEQRHIVAEGESTTDMAVAASRKALLTAGVAAQDLDVIVVATITPDLVFPSTGAMVQARLGARNVGAFDLSAACSGFVYGMAVADSLIVSGRCSAALVVGAERMSVLLDWQDRSTCVLFGDGAGAAVLVPSSTPGIQSIHLHADGSTPEVLCAPSKKSRFLHMEGGAVFRFAVRGLVEAGNEALKANDLDSAQVDWLIPHQANQRIIDTAARKLGFGPERTIATVSHHANTSAASIPLALDDAVQRSLISAGHRLLLLSVGGGFTWASTLLRWA